MRAAAVPPSDDITALGNETADSGAGIPPLISEFLRAGTRKDNKAYDPALLPRTWSLVKILLKQSKAQQEPSEGNALNTAINTSKGKAVEALLDHALRWCRLNHKSDGHDGLLRSPS